MQLWDQQDGESNAAFQAFREGFLSQGPERTLAKAAELLGRELALIHKLASHNDWIKRARAYDRWILKIEESTVKKSIEKDALTWARRRSEFRELEYSLAHSLIDQAKAILALPLTEQTIESESTEPGEDGLIHKTVIIVKPVRATKRDAAILLDCADKLARLSSNMETERKLLGVMGIDIRGDENERLMMAKQVFEQLKEEYRDRPDVMLRLPRWVGEDWGINPLQLTEGEPSEAQIEAPDAEN